MFIELPPDQYLFHPELLLMLPRTRLGINRVFVSGGLFGSFGASLGASFAELSTSEGIPTLASLKFLLNWSLESLATLGAFDPRLLPDLPIRMATDEKEPAEGFGS